MAKQIKLYFSHDFGARNDPKLQGLLMEMGYEGLGIYWAIVETLYEQGGYIEARYLKAMAYAMHVEAVKLEQVLTGFGLFETDGKAYWSEGVMRRLEEMEREAEKRSAAGKKAISARWEAKNIKTDTDVDTNEYARNTDVNTNEYERITDVSSEEYARNTNEDTNEYARNTIYTNKINKINKINEKKESVCDSHTPAHTHEELEFLEKFEKFNGWCEMKAPLANAFKEPLTLEGFVWLYRRYGGEKLKQCASDLHAKSAPAKNRNALNAYKKFIERL